MGAVAVDLDPGRRLGLGPGVAAEVVAPLEDERPGGRCSRATVSATVSPKKPEPTTTRRRARRSRPRSPQQRLRGRARRGCQARRAPAEAVPAGGCRTRRRRHPCRAGAPRRNGVAELTAASASIGHPRAGEAQPPRAASCSPAVAAPTPCRCARLQRPRARGSTARRHAARPAATPRHARAPARSSEAGGPWRRPSRSAMRSHSCRRDTSRARALRSCAVVEQGPPAGRGERRRVVRQVTTAAVVGHDVGHPGRDHRQAGGEVLQRLRGADAAGRLVEREGHERDVEAGQDRRQVGVAGRAGVLEVRRPAAGRRGRSSRPGRRRGPSSRAARSASPASSGEVQPLVDDADVPRDGPLVVGCAAPRRGRSARPPPRSAEQGRAPVR